MKLNIETILYGNPGIVQEHLRAHADALETALALYDRLRTSADLVLDVIKELHSARVHHKKDFHSAHEGWAVLREEVDELWDEVKKNPKTDEERAAHRVRMRKEAVQVAAMAFRFIEDVCDV